MLTAAIKTHNVHFSGSASETNGRPQIYEDRATSMGWEPIEGKNLDLPVSQVQIRIHKVLTKTIP
uniref:Uncharacterized protein n=1 Tax=Vitis vinifera TaxID=29760 RepID=F6HPW7_VITVI